MDFSLNDEQLATRDLAKQILGDLATRIAAFTASSAAGA